MGGFRGVSSTVAADPPPIAGPRRQQRLVKPLRLLRWCSGLAVGKRRDGGRGEGGRSVVDLVGGVAAANGGGWQQRKMFMNVYFVKYQIDGSYWPLAHNATIFALILTQVVAGILFG
ncbi:hypothetical protein Tco_1564692, partial [Tanacetum coccineum]